MRVLSFKQHYAYLRRFRRYFAPLKSSLCPLRSLFHSQFGRSSRYLHAEREEERDVGDVDDDEAGHHGGQPVKEVQNAALSVRSVEVASLRHTALQNENLQKNQRIDFYNQNTE